MQRLRNLNGYKRSQLGSKRKNSQKKTAPHGQHASKQPPHNTEFILIVLLPLSTESPHSDSMILNGMTVMKQTTNHNNQGLIPFVTMEQPLFAFSDTMQWTWPELHGENKIVVMLGG